MISEQITMGGVEKKILAENTYSTEERQIGYWIDGKPIYRKYIEFPRVDMNATGGQYDLLNVSALNIEYLINITLYQVTNQSDLSARVVAKPMGRVISGMLRVYSIPSDTFNLATDKGVIEYTKTAD